MAMISEEDTQLESCLTLFPTVGLGPAEASPEEGLSEMERAGVGTGDLVPLWKA